MKKLIIVSALLVYCLCTGVIFGQTTGNSTIDVILSGYTARKMAPEPVTDSQIDLILKCGMKAPSARNSQLWKFTVVKDKTLIGKIIPNVTPGNILIVVSGQESNQAGINVGFDCALATENMFIAAQALGLGGHIYGGPVNNVNSTLKPDLGIPEDYRVVTILLIGNIDKTVDAVSSASTRKPIGDIVNYK
jgi:nitroreductase